jgi:hypothetical protein
MLKAYRERPTIKNVMEGGGVGKRIARRAIMEGWPHHGYTPFAELPAGGTSIHKEMAVYRDNWEEAAVTKGEAARQAAEEAMAARISMDAALRASRLTQSYVLPILKKLEEDPEAHIPEDISPKVIYQLTKALESSAAVVEKAMKIEQMRAGKPERVLGVEIGILLERCSDDELEFVVSEGELPARIIDQRKRIAANLAQETDAEAIALAEAAAEEVAEEEIPESILKQVQDDGEAEDICDGEAEAATEPEEAATG